MRLDENKNRTIPTPERSESEAAYKMYERQVIARAANSIGCLPKDLSSMEFVVLTLWESGLDQFEAAKEVEDRLGEEGYYCNHIKNYVRTN